MKLVHFPLAQSDGTYGSISKGNLLKIQSVLRNGAIPRLLLFSGEQY